MTLKKREQFTLTDDERTAGRVFRDEQQAVLEARRYMTPPTYSPPQFLALFRHLCPARGNVSTALQLHEVYITDDSDRFCFIYKAGTCRGCGQTAISPKGKFDLTSRRPPLEGRLARG